MVLANPPFAGSLDYESTAKDLQQVVKTKKTELLFLALFLRLLQTGGRAAVIVPDGVLFGSSNAHKTLRRILVEEQKLDAIVSMPSGVFKPYAGVSTAILLFTKTNSGGTDHVWFYDMQADGYSLDDKRTPQPEKSDLADILARWQNREVERKRQRTDQSFLVPKTEITGNDYDLSINRYKEVEYEAVEYDPPMVIMERLAERWKRRSRKNAKVLEEAIGMSPSRVPLGVIADFVNGGCVQAFRLGASTERASSASTTSPTQRSAAIRTQSCRSRRTLAIWRLVTNSCTQMLRPTLSQPGDIVLCIRATIGDRNWSDREYMPRTGRSRA